MTNNRWMNAMLFIVVVFYSFVLISHLRVSKSEKAKAISENAQLLGEMRQMEETARRNLLERPELLNTLSALLTTVFFFGLFLDIRLLVHRRRGQSWPENSLNEANICWGTREVVGGFIFLLFAEACLFLAQEVAHRWLGNGGPLPDVWMFGASLLRDLLVAIFVWALIKARHGQSLRELGLRFERVTESVRMGLVGYVAVLPSLLLTFLTVAALLNLFSMEPVPQNVVQIFLKDSTSPYLIYITLFVALLGPVLEEIFFRGFAYAGLRKRFGIWGAACIASAVFAALHMNAVAFVPIFLLGMFLTYLYERSGSLIPSITAHALHNGIMVALTLGFKSLSS